MDQAQKLTERPTTARSSIQSSLCANGKLVIHPNIEQQNDLSKGKYPLFPVSEVIVVNNTAYGKGKLLVSCEGSGIETWYDGYGSIASEIGNKPGNTEDPYVAIIEHEEILGPRPTSDSQTAYFLRKLYCSQYVKLPSPIEGRVKKATEQFQLGLDGILYRIFKGNEQRFSGGLSDDQIILDNALLVTPTKSPIEDFEIIDNLIVLLDADGNLWYANISKLELSLIETSSKIIKIIHNASSNSGLAHALDENGCLYFLVRPRADPTILLSKRILEYDSNNLLLKELDKSENNNIASIEEYFGKITEIFTGLSGLRERFLGITDRGKLLSIFYSTERKLRASLVLSVEIPELITDVVQIADSFSLEIYNKNDQTTKWILLENTHYKPFSVDVSYLGKSCGTSTTDYSYWYDKEDYDRVTGSFQIYRSEGGSHPLKLYNPRFYKDFSSSSLRKKSARSLPKESSDIVQKKRKL